MNFIIIVALYGILLIIPIIMVKELVKQFKNNSLRARLNEKPHCSDYIVCRCRCDYRGSRKRVKSLNDYYIIEKDIKFP